MDGDQEKTPDQHQKEKKQNPCPHKPQLLTDDGKNHIILCLRDKAQLLDTSAKTRAKKAAGADGIEPLDRLKSFLVALRVPPDRNAFKTVALKPQKDSHKACSRPEKPHEGKIERTGDKDQNHGDAKDNDGSAEITGSHETNDGQNQNQGPEKLQHPLFLLLSSADGPGQK